MKEVVNFVVVVVVVIVVVAWLCCCWCCCRCVVVGGDDGSCVLLPVTSYTIERLRDMTGCPAESGDSGFMCRSLL